MNNTFGKATKFLNKKITLGTCISAVFVFAGTAFLISHGLAVSKSNKILTDLQAKQNFFTVLREADNAVRQEYINTVDTNEVITGALSGYILALNDENCKIFSEEEYSQYQTSQNIGEKNFSFEKLSDTVALIQFGNINYDELAEFKVKMSALQSQGINSLVVDFSGVKTDSIATAYKILESIMPAGEIVYTIDRSGEKKCVFQSFTNGNLDIKLAILTNEETSGSAEIIVSALKNSGRAKIVGAKTAGNAIQIKETRLSNKQILLFPTAHYVTLGGEVFYKVGVEPDIHCSKTEALSKAIETLQ